MLLRIEHLTCYAYGVPVPYSIQQLRLTPVSTAQQTVKHWQIKAPGELTQLSDAYGNCTHTLVMTTPHQALTIAVSGEIDTHGGATLAADALPPPVFLRQTPLTDADAAMQAFAQLYAQRHPLDLMHAIRAQMPYQAGVTRVETPAAQAFALGAGVCQDHTHVFIGCCRWLGWPARYVSGYLYTEEGHLLQTHAWAEVWQTAHWLGVDVSNGILVNESHVRLACGLDYRSASPISGMRTGGQREGMASQVMVSSGATHPPNTLGSMQADWVQQALMQQAMAQLTAPIAAPLVAPLSAEAATASSDSLTAAALPVTVAGAAQQ